MQPFLYVRTLTVVTNSFRAKKKNKLNDDDSNYSNNKFAFTVTFHGFVLMAYLRIVLTSMDLYFRYNRIHYDKQYRLFYIDYIRFYGKQNASFIV